MHLYWRPISKYLCFLVCAFGYWVKVLLYRLPIKVHMELCTKGLFLPYRFSKSTLWINAILGLLSLKSLSQPFGTAAHTDLVDCLHGAGPCEPSSWTKTLISQSALCTFASAFTLITLALCMKCRRTLKGTLLYMGWVNYRWSFWSISVYDNAC